MAGIRDFFPSSDGISIARIYFVALQGSLHLKRDEMFFYALIISELI